MLKMYIFAKKHYQIVPLRLKFIINFMCLVTDILKLSSIQKNEKRT